MKKIPLNEALKPHQNLNHRLLESLKEFGDRIVYKAIYPYGDQILDSGTLKLPGDVDCPNDLVATADSRLSTTPLALVLDNCVEVYENVIVDDFAYRLPLQILRAGEFFGVFETCDYILKAPMGAAWNLTAGATSVKTIANIGNEKLVTELIRRLPSGEDGRELRQQYRGISQNEYKLVALADRVASADPHKKGEAGRSGWTTEVIFFPWSWFDSDVTLKKVRCPLFEISHHQSAGARNLLSQQTLRTRIHGKKKCACRIQHIVDVLTGTGHFFEPVVDQKQELGPFLEISSTIAEILTTKLRQNYWPVFLQPTTLSKCHSVGYMPLNRWPYISDSKIKSAFTLCDVVIDDLRAILQESPDLRSLLNSAALVFFNDGDPMAKPAAIFHGEQRMQKLGSTQAPTWLSRNLIEERVDGFFPTRNGNAPDRWHHESDLLKPVIKVIPRRAAMS